MTFDIVIIQRCMLIGLTVLFLSAIYLYRKKRLSDRMICGIILCAGSIMRIGYALYTPCYLRGHDIGEFSMNAYGKAGYILQLIVDAKLPDSYTLQFYQQPLFFILGAFASKGINAISGRSDYFALVDAAKSVSVIASCLTLFVLNKLCDEFDLKGIPKYASLLYVAFMPVCYLMGGRVGEGALLLLFMALAVLFTRYWERKPSFWNTILLALVYGFGVMTKTSMAVPAVYTAIVFIKTLFGKETKQRGVLIWKEAMFLIISLPLGLWYNVRNFLQFGQPLGYVLPLEIESPYYTGQESLFARFIKIDIKGLLSTPFDTPISDVSLPTYLIKGELFGEFTYEIPSAIPIILLLLHLILTVYLVYVVIQILLHKDSSKKDRLLAALIVGWYVFAILANIRYPFGCTMDFRYYSFLTILKALLLGRRLVVPENNSLKELGIQRNQILTILLALFCIFSILMFVLIKR